MISKEDCARGAECGVHYRVSDHFVDGGTLIDYVGSHAIITQTASDEMFAISIIGGTPVDAYTWVYDVGQGVLGDIADDLDARRVNYQRITVPVEGGYLDTPETYIQYIIDAHKASVEIQQVLTGL